MNSQKNNKSQGNKMNFKVISNIFYLCVLMVVSTISFAEEDPTKFGRPSTDRLELSADTYVSVNNRWVMLWNDVRLNTHDSNGREIGYDTISFELEENDGSGFKDKYNGTNLGRTIIKTGAETQNYSYRVRAHIDYDVYVEDDCDDEYDDCDETSRVTTAWSSIQTVRYTYEIPPRLSLPAQSDESGNFLVSWDNLAFTYLDEVTWDNEFYFNEEVCTASPDPDESGDECDEEYYDEPNWLTVENEYVIQVRERNGAWQDFHTESQFSSNTYVSNRDRQPRLTYQAAGGSGGVKQYRLVYNKYFISSEQNCVEAYCLPQGRHFVSSDVEENHVSILIVALPAPEKLTAITTNSNIVSLEWTAVQSNQNIYYQIQESQISSGGVFTNDVAYTTTDTVFDVPVNTKDGDLAYKVRACVSLTCSDWSGIALTNAISKPNPVNNLRLVSVDGVTDGSLLGSAINPQEYSGGTFRLYFNAPENAVETDIKTYRIRIRENGGDYRNLEEVDSSLDYEFSQGHYRQYTMPVGNYEYQVQACNSLCDCGEFVSSQNEVTVLNVPSAPSQIAVTPLNSNGLITLDWAASNGLMVTNYDVQQVPGYSLMNTGEPTRLLQPLSATSVKMGRETGVYSFRVRGCNLSGCGGWSSNSSQVAVTTPGTPRALIADSVSHTYSPYDYADADGGYKIDWRDVNDFTDSVLTYKLTETNPQGQSTVYEKTYSGSNFSKQIEGTYQYKVQACTADACGEETESISVEVAFQPSIPNGLTAEQTNDSVTVQWNESNNVGRYELQQSIDGGVWTTLIDESGLGLTRSISILENGTHSYAYQVRACNGSDRFELCSDYSNQDVAVVEQSYDIADAPAPEVGTPPAQPDDSDRVSSFNGQFSVNESGAATYTFGIQVAAGTAGVAPQLGLQYSSHAPNGLVGLGWNITGLGNISRCGQTLNQDNTATAVRLNEDDRFCLDGRRLLAVSGTYGAAGTIYKTEIDTYVKVESHGNENGGPSYFTVKKKDGSTSYYGQTSDSRNSVSDGVLAWELDRFEDSIGNQITYSYANDNDGMRIEEVAYAYGKTTEANAKVKYIYDGEDRPDILQSYMAGELKRYAKRLQKIESYNNDELLRQYNLNYLDDASSNATNQVAGNTPSRMSGIVVCTSGNVCLPETTFDWKLPADGSLFAGGGRRFSVEAVPPSSSYDNNFFVDSRQGDINGDGRLDVIYLTSHVKVKRRFLRKPKIKSHQRLHYLIDTPNGFIEGGNWYYEDSHEKPVQFQTFDYNADGHTDLLVKSETGGWHMYLSVHVGLGQWKLVRQSGGFPFSSDNIAFADMNGDGLVDVFDGTEYWPLQRNGSADSSNKPYTFSSTSKTVDYTKGDSFDWTANLGETDFDPELGYDPVFQSEECEDYNANDEDDDYYDCTVDEYNEQNPHNPVTTNTNPPPYSEEYYSTQHYGVKRTAGDINGDGITDFLIQKGGYQLAISDIVDGEFRLQPVENGPRVSDHILIEFADINVDGLTDVVYWDSSSKRWSFVLSTGRGFTDAQVIAGSGLSTNSADTAEDNRIKLADVNNDGYPDISWHQKTETVNAGDDDEYDNQRLWSRHWNNATQSFTSQYILRGFLSGGSNAGHALADVNGDAITDYVNTRPALFNFNSSNDKFDFTYTYGGDSQSQNYSDETQTAEERALGNIITKITNGFGAQTMINYERLSLSHRYMRLDADVTTGACRHRVGRGCNTGFGNNYAALNNPFGDLDADSDSLQIEKPLSVVFGTNQPIPIVATVDSSAPTRDNPEGLSRLEYSYGHGRYQVGGIGNLGFKYLSTVDVQTGVVTTNTYRQDWPFVGYPLKTEVFSGSGHLLSRSSNKWSIKKPDVETFSVNDGTFIDDLHDDGTTSKGSLQVYLAESTEEAFALKGNGALEGDNLSKVVTTNTQDGYGNTTKIEVVHTDISKNAVIQRQTTVSEYGTSLFELEMGRLSKTTATTVREHDGQDPLTRVSSFTYYKDTDDNEDLIGLLKTETIQPSGDQSETLTTTHNYDDFGNLVHSFIQGWGGGDQSNVTRLGVENEYDDIGRYMLRSYQTYPNGVGRQMVSEVLGRNKYGSETIIKGINGSKAYTYFSKMGVQYFTTSDSGGYGQTYLSQSASEMSLCQSHSAYVQISKAAGGGRSKDCFDILGRSIRKLAVNFDGSWVARDVTFDNIGRTIEQSEPFSITSGEQKGILFTSIDYDITGRAVHAIAPNSSQTWTNYDNLTTVETNDLSQAKTTITNIIGDVIQVTDASNSSTYYQHNSHGDLVMMTDAFGNKTTIVYDALGRKLVTNDPDKGEWSYEYNSFGEFIKQVDAKGQVITTQFDALGREVLRVDKIADSNSASDIENTTTWIYDRKTNESGNELNVGQLLEERDSNGYSMVYSYDQFGRNHQSVMTVPSLPEEYTTKQTFDQFGRPFQSFDTSNGQKNNGIRGMQTIYNEYGLVSETRNVTENGSTDAGFYERILETDVRGNTTKYVLGNGIVVTKRYNPATGWLESVQSIDPFTYNKIQDLSYHWDTVGNLLYRKDHSGTKQLEESFTYDEMNRLTGSYTDNGSGSINQTLAYDAIGNIKYKSDVGHYTYGENGVGPHAVTSVERVVDSGDDFAGLAEIEYKYDLNGNNVLGDNRSLNYSVFDKVTKVTRGSHTTEFSYGTGRSRYKRVDTDSSSGGTHKTTYYLGNVQYISYTQGDRRGEKEFKREIGMALETILYDDNGFVKQEINYLLQDHLGSTDVIADANGQVVQELSFDAWGERRNGSNWVPIHDQVELAKFDTNITTRGYTGHEMVDGVGIIHMNGRIYDPKLARFLQADPHIQEPYNTQSLNRYSYVINNPLNKTDPTGYFFGAIAAIASVATGGIGSFLAIQAFYFYVLPPEYHGVFNSLVGVVSGAICGPCSIGVSRTTSFHSNFSQTGDFGQAYKAGFIAGAAATAFYFAGNAFGVDGAYKAKGSPINTAAFIGVHGVIGGVLAELQGGSFGDGFVSAGVGKSVTLAGGAIGGGLSDEGKLLTSVLAAGSASELTGGKFANGAFTAALAFAANFFGLEETRARIADRFRGKEGLDRRRSEVGGRRADSLKSAVIIGMQRSRGSQEIALGSNDQAVYASNIYITSEGDYWVSRADADFATTGILGGVDRYFPGGELVAVAGYEAYWATKGQVLLSTVRGAEEVPTFVDVSTNEQNTESIIYSYFPDSVVRKWDAWDGNYVPIDIHKPRNDSNGR